MITILARLEIQGKPSAGQDIFSAIGSAHLEAVGMVTLEYAFLHLQFHITKYCYDNDFFNILYLGGVTQANEQGLVVSLKKIYGRKNWLTPSWKVRQRCIHNRRSCDPEIM